MDETQNENYRCLVTLRDKKTGEEKQVSTRSYRAPGTAKGQATYKAKSYWRHYDWVRTELQQATWTTVEVLK